MFEWDGVVWICVDYRMDVDVYYSSISDGFVIMLFFVLLKGILILLIDG